MPKEARTGVITPIKITETKKLADGTTKKYTRWRAKIDGKYVSAKTFTKCNEKIKQALKERARYGQALNTSAKLGEYADQWLATKETTTDPSTYANYRTIVQTHIKAYRNHKINDITPTLIRRMIDSMKVRGGKPASVVMRRQLRTVLNQIFTAAVADRVIPANPVSAVPAPRAKDIGHQSENERQAFTPEEAMRILQAASQLPIEQGAIWWWLFLTGMRRGEVLGASEMDLSFERTKQGMEYGVYQVNWKLEEVPKKHGCDTVEHHPRLGDPYPCGISRAAACPQVQWRVPYGFDITPLVGRYCLTRPKSQVGRIVPLVPALTEVLVKYQEATAHWDNPYGLFFHKPDGMPIAPTEILAEYRSLLVAAGIPNVDERVVHETRHTTVTLLYALGVDSGMIQAIIGHSSFKMSQHYRHIDVAARVTALSGIESELNLNQITWK